MNFFSGTKTFNSIQDWGGGGRGEQKGSPFSFSPVTSADVGVSP